MTIAVSCKSYRKKSIGKFVCDQSNTFIIWKRNIITVALNIFSVNFAVKRRIFQHSEVTINRKCKKVLLWSVAAHVADC